MGNVKGSALASRVLWVELGHGATGTDRLIAQSSPELRAAIENRIDKARWYPFELFIELNLTIDRLFGRGDMSLVRVLGRFGADANLTTIYRLFFKVGSVHWILGRGVRLWGAHYDSGASEIATRGPRTAVLRVRDFDTPHAAHCLSVQGWMERSVELSGGKRVICEESQCRLRGDEMCQFEGGWE